MVKVCSKCGEPKPLEKHRTICSDCNRKRTRLMARERLLTPEGREANRAKQNAFRASPEGEAYFDRYFARPDVVARVREGRQRRRGTPEGRLRSLLNGTKKRAAYHGLVYALSMQNMVMSDACAATGIAFDFSVPETHRVSPWAPSIDRIDSNGGYTPENVQIVCWAYNLAKNEYGTDVLLHLARAIVDTATRTDV